MTRPPALGDQHRQRPVLRHLHAQRPPPDVNVKRLDIAIEALIAGHVAGGAASIGSIAVRPGQRRFGYTTTRSTPSTRSCRSAGVVPCPRSSRAAVVDATPTTFQPAPGPFVLDLHSSAATASTASSADSTTGFARRVSVAFGRCCTDDDVIAIADVDGTDDQPHPIRRHNQYAAASSADGARLVYRERRRDDRQPVVET